MKIHPFAELFPPVDEDALRRLAQDIAANGLRHPIWILDGQILDGRNRWNACKLVGVECKAVEYEGDDPLGFVVSLNLHRRQLTPSQRAMIGVELDAQRSKEAVRRKSERCRELALQRQRDQLGKHGSDASQVPPKVGEPGSVVGSVAPQPLQDATDTYGT